jgi:hypothetical protein
MQSVLTTLPRTLIALSTIAFVGLIQFPVQADQVQIENGLFYPRSSEEFFKQGRQQLELEIQRLQNPRPETPLLTISPALEQQLKIELQQREQGKPPVQPEQPIAPPPPISQ